MSKAIKYPGPYLHDHPPVVNVNELFEKKKTVGQKASDKIAETVGSWKFIIIQSIFLLCWAVLNVTAYVYHWDPYPFILMNLFLSLQAAYTAPILMMSQNRMAEKDRIEAHNDYQVNQKTEVEVRVILDHLTAQNDALTEMLRLLNERVTK
ncbi:MAG: DUF1003 domain-containing protein [Ignavibacteria bacterium]|nr:DUF1003 domain-containing protein [Ignavibacteria bacterium]